MTGPAFDLRLAAPSDAEVRAARTDVYERLRDRELSLIVRGIYKSAARETRAQASPDGEAGGDR